MRSALKEPSDGEGREGCWVLKQVKMRNRRAPAIWALECSVLSCTGRVVEWIYGGLVRLVYQCVRR